MGKDVAGMFGAMGKRGTLAILAGLAVWALVLAGAALAGHNGADVDVETKDGETTITASIIDPGGTHVSNNMVLVVHADGETHTADIPTDGSSVEITVGPFSESTTISWRVFGGGERDYDDPSWNGYGEEGFNEDVAEYGEENGFAWVVAGPDDDNPFTTWHEEQGEGCKDGGWEDMGFRNQGQCIRYVNIGQDSR